ncbi:MAG: type II secretion system protein GspN [Deltaproteobacteria bacterium]|nr:type II secretion system protein GspN [Deltaproteobacteria bacterium]
MQKDEQMKVFISRNKRYFFYGIYSVILLIALLYIRFPSDAFKEYLQETSSRVSPENVLIVGEVKPAFPAGIKLLGTGLSPKENSDKKYFSASRIIIRPRIWACLTGGLNLNFLGDVNEGLLKGSVNFRKNRIGGPFETSIEIKGMHVDGASLPSSFTGFDLNGILSGVLSFQTENEQIITGTGEADISISEGRIILSNPILIFNSIEFDDLSIKCVMEKEKLRLIHFRLKGQDMTGTLSGEIDLRSNILKSAIDISGAIELSPGFFKNRKDSSDFIRHFRQLIKNGRLSFVLTGNIGEPRFRFL